MLMRMIVDDVSHLICAGMATGIQRYMVIRLLGQAGN